jgi:hypothetical protein
MHAGTPILASRLVEIERVITTHHIGSILSEVSPDAIASAINELKGQPELLILQKDACRKAAEIENWENERLKLELLIRYVLTNYSL